MREIAIIAFFLFSACSTREPLELALRQAGDNRRELQEVIDHYSQTPADSLKLRAAEYLIINMPGHYSITDEITSDYFEKVRRMYNVVPLARMNMLFSLPQFYMAYEQGMPQDIHHITADFLIHHIDRLFDISGEMVVSGDVPFNIFCEYLLPYRITNEPLDYLMQENFEFDRKIQDDICQFGLYGQEMKDFITFLYDKTINDNFHTFRLPFPINDQITTNDCISTALYNKKINNILGIPSAIFLTPHHHNKNGRHYWTSAIYNSEDIQKAARLNADNAKVYMITYECGYRPEENGNEIIPDDFLRWKLKDVTIYVRPTSDITVDLPKTVNSTPRYAYLAVFNEMEWRPVAWTEIKNDRATFKDMGNGALYQTIYFDSIKKHMTGYPFILSGNDEIKTFVPNKNNPETITLRRKYPLTGDKVERILSLQGFYLIVSSEKEFKQADTLSILNSSPVAPYYNITNEIKTDFRFIRLIPDEEQHNYASIAEIIMYDEYNNKMNIKPIDREFNVLFDGDLLSFQHFNKSINIEVPELICPSRIEIIPQTDENDIYPYDIYELFFADIDGWKSLGVQIATDYYLKYENVPSGALLWLHNHTKGKEERPFTYTGGKIRFY